LANVYLLSKDYDHAIELGETLAEIAPDYGYAMFDYTLALEEKLEQSGRDTQALQKLAAVYERLQILAARPEQRFTAATLAYILERAKEVNDLLGNRSAHP
jgi:lipoprotein NlpI